MDIYFKPEWIYSCQEIEDGTPVIYEFQNEYGKISYNFFKRKIPILYNDEEYYDIISPYGYGGPLILEYQEGCKDKLLKDFQEDFSKYCKENKIVSEFVRFHPIYNNGKDFLDFYDVSSIRKTVGTDLTKEDPFQEEFSKSTRKLIRRLLKEGVEYQIIEDPNKDDIEDFFKIYYSTMDRNEASDFYYFTKDYFYKCLELFGKDIIIINVLIDNITVASAFYIRGDGIIHAHLSGTLQEYIKYSPAYIIKYATILWGKDHGYRLVHYGGGTTNSPDDSLLKFKKKFTKDTLFDFSIGKKIWDKDVYDHLVNQTNSQDSSFFPQYRSIENSWKCLRSGL